MCIVSGMKYSRPGRTSRTELICAGDVLDAVDDLAALRAEDDVAVLSHDLHDEFLAAQIAHFIQMLNGKVDDTLELRLTNINDTSASDMFPQKHAKVRRCHRGGFI